MGMEHRITGPAPSEQDCSADKWVRETGFGRWFLGTGIWREYVLAEALDPSFVAYVDALVPDDDVHEPSAQFVAFVDSLDTSDGSPSHFACAPVASTTASAV